MYKSDVDIDVCGISIPSTKGVLLAPDERDRMLCHTMYMYL